MVLGRKANFFLGKKWFWAGKPIFSYRKPNKTSLWTLAVLFPQKKCCFWFCKSWFSLPIFFLGKNWFFTPKPFFPRKTLVFLPKTIFCLGKTKNTIFLECGRIVSQFFWVFPRKSWFWIGSAQCCRWLRAHVEPEWVDWLVLLKCEIDFASPWEIQDPDLTSNLNELTDTFSWHLSSFSVVLARYRIRTCRKKAGLTRYLRYKTRVGSSWGGYHIYTPSRPQPTFYYTLNL